MDGHTSLNASPLPWSLSNDVDSHVTVWIINGLPNGGYSTATAQLRLRAVPGFCAELTPLESRGNAVTLLVILGGRVLPYPAIRDRVNAVGVLQAVGPTGVVLQHQPTAARADAAEGVPVKARSVVIWRRQSRPPVRRRAGYRGRRVLDQRPGRWASAAGLQRSGRVKQHQFSPPDQATHRGAPTTRHDVSGSSRPPRSPIIEIIHNRPRFDPAPRSAHDQGSDLHKYAAGGSIPFTAGSCGRRACAGRPRPSTGCTPSPRTRRAA